MWINKPFDQRWPIPVSNYTKCIIIFHMVVCCIKESAVTEQIIPQWPGNLMASSPATDSCQLHVLLQKGNPQTTNDFVQWC